MRGAKAGVSPRRRSFHCTFYFVGNILFFGVVPCFFPALTNDPRAFLPPSRREQLLKSDGWNGGPGAGATVFIFEYDRRFDQAYPESFV